MTSQFDQGPKVMSYKQVAKWIKSKGRGKLRNYCTMCARQFRDKKGLKNHMGSQSHLEKMRDFNANPEYYLQKFSDDFENGFLNILKRMYSNRFVFARTVYTEYCHILHHRHLNSTFWETLDDFIKHLESKKICEVKKGEKGYYIRYIPQADDIEIKEKEEKKVKKKKRVETDEEAHMRIIKTQMKQAKKKSSKTVKSDVDNSRVRPPPSKPSEVKKAQHKEPKLISLGNLKKKKFENIFSGKKRKRGDDSNDDVSSREPSLKKLKIDNGTTDDNKKKKKPKIWIMKGIIVKVLHKKLEGGKYYKKKAKMIETIPNSKFGVVEMLDKTARDRIRIHQKYLETVIPKLGSRVMLLKKDKRGQICTLTELKKKKYCGVLKFEDGHTEEVDYEDFSRFSLK